MFSEIHTPELNTSPGVDDGQRQVVASTVVRLTGVEQQAVRRPQQPKLQLDGQRAHRQDELG